MADNKEPIDHALLRDYFEAHEAAYQQITGKGFAACMAAANLAAQQLRAMPRPEPKVYS